MNHIHTTLGAAVESLVETGVFSSARRPDTSRPTRWVTKVCLRSAADNGAVL